MAHELAKTLLRNAKSFPTRVDATKKALYLGMPLQEIENYFDWLDQMKEIMRKVKMIDSGAILLILFGIIAVGGLWLNAGATYWIGWHGLAIFTVSMLQCGRLVKGTKCCE